MNKWPDHRPNGFYMTALSTKNWVQILPLALKSASLCRQPIRGPSKEGRNHMLDDDQHSGGIQ